MILTSLDKYRDLGLLVLRVGIGAMFIYHGYTKILGGPKGWEGLGKAGMSPLGIDFGFVFFGFMAAFSETVGGLCLILGGFFRVAAALLFMTMIGAAGMHLSLPPEAPAAGLKGASHAIESGILFFSLLFIGPGKFSLDEKLCCKKS